MSKSHLQLPAEIVAIDPFEVHFVLSELSLLMRGIKSDWLRQAVGNAQSQVAGLKPTPDGRLDTLTSRQSKVA